MNKHTPGPQDSHAFSGFELCKTCGQARGATERDEFNARLIKAAPELLEELKAMVDWALKMNKVPRPNSPVARARAAIAKAEGQ